MVGTPRGELLFRLRFEYFWAYIATTIRCGEETFEFVDAPDQGQAIEGR